MESPIFDVTVDLKVFKELVDTWNKCLHLVHHLDGFKKGFDVSLLDLENDGRLEPFNSDNKVIDMPIDNEFYSLLHPEAMDPFIVAARFIPSNEEGSPVGPSEAGEPSFQPIKPGDDYLSTYDRDSALRNIEGIFPLRKIDLVSVLVTPSLCALRQF
ncbi:hypothetical protein Salat_1469100 [Sesamum alatum]|uniref:Uncharacterized protein n=1 Tax=Sesamum alatum TaxID=300844 RepID=A0AAE1YBL7_9LAMI|nr:hypothetical protein Salat_1469100 [Sesamum alatum]